MRTDYVQRLGPAVVVALCIAFPASAFAAAGQVLFVYGKAEVHREPSRVIAVQKGQEVESGDTIVTYASGRLQLRMQDGSLLALRPGTEFLIEDYHYPEPGDTTDNRPPRSFYTLLKGGFRSITGAIGKEDRNRYRVRTPVATIGIRGTDYDAVFCDTACAEGDIGLHVSVNEGGVLITNGAGFLELDAGQSAYVADGDTPPEQLGVTGIVAVPESENESGAEPDPVVNTTGESDTGVPVDFSSGVESFNGQPGAVAFSGGPLATAGQFSGVSTGDQANLVVDDAGALNVFTGPFPGATGATQYQVSTATITDRGEDPTTGLRWGRWEGGEIVVTSDDGTRTTESLGAGSLHWITGDLDEPRPVVPSSGTMSFTLIGNTDPTDNAGNVGVLGSATLDADFTNQTVDTSVDLSINNQNWDAQASGKPLDGPTATFGGAFDSVTVTDVANPPVNGSGEFQGFFSGDANGQIDGAALGYSLSDDAGTSVSGAAAFQTEPGN